MVTLKYAKIGIITITSGNAGNFFFLYTIAVPVAVPKVHVQTRTKFVDRPVYRTVVQEKPVHHTVVKTVQKPVPKPIPFMQTQIVKQFVPKIKKVVQHFPVPKIVTQHHVQKVAVPMVKTQTVVKNVPRPHLVTQYVDRVKTVHNKVPVKVPIVHHQKVPMIQEKIVPQIIEQIKPQIVVRDNVRTVVKNHVQQVPKIIRELVDRPGE
ncbi:mantle protein-like isoform X1 [Argopecten irradians]|uniref:mantle protein-like isoform X1 n=1 Tax=Argopecten irradians TaxID=31199 RepID=UPI003710A95D